MSHILSHNMPIRGIIFPLFFVASIDLTDCRLYILADTWFLFTVIIIIITFVVWIAFFSFKESTIFVDHKSVYNVYVWSDTYALILNIDLTEWWQSPIVKERHWTHCGEMGTSRRKCAFQYRWSFFCVCMYWRFSHIVMNRSTSFLYNLRKLCTHTYT